MNAEEPKTLCIEWLSTCQRFSFIKDINAILETSGEDKIFEPIYANLTPIVGAVAVQYTDNCFSVFIGIAMGLDETKDIDYIKKMGQRTTENIARAIFPQFCNLTYCQ